MPNNVNSKTTKQQTILELKMPDNVAKPGEIIMAICKAGKCLEAPNKVGLQTQRTDVHQSLELKAIFLSPRDTLSLTLQVLFQLIYFQRTQNINFSVIFLSKQMLLLQLSQFQNNCNGVVAEGISIKQEEYFRDNSAWHKNQGRDVISFFLKF